MKRQGGLKPAALAAIAGILSGTGIGSAQTGTATICAAFGDTSHSPPWCQAALKLNAPSSHNPAGPPRDGLALSLAAVPGYYRIGSPIWVTGEIRNVSSQMLSGRLWPAATAAFDFTITPAAGGPPAARTGSGDLLQSVALWNSFIIPPGSSKFFAVRLDKIYQLSAPGQYFVHLDTNDVSLGASIDRPNVGLHAVPLASNTIAINLLPPREPGPGAPHPNSVYEGVPTTNSAGKPVRGFALSLPQHYSTRDFGAPIDVTVELRNLTQQPHEVAFGNRAHAYDFLIVNDRTHAVVRRADRGTTGYDRSPLESRASAIYPDTALFGRFELRSLYNFTAAGSYTIRVRYGRPTIDGETVALESNPMHVTLRYVPHTTWLTEANAGHVFTINLQSLRPAYIAGQPIRLRVTLTNDTDFVYWTDAAPPWGIVKLSVSDAKGAALPGWGRGGYRGGVFRIQYYPGVPVVLGFQDPAAPRTYPEWADFRHWGYEQPPAGEYTLSASNISGGQTNHTTTTFFQTTADRSEPLRVQVLSTTEASRVPSVKLDDPRIGALLRDVLSQSTALQARLAAIAPQIKDPNDATALDRIGYYRWIDDTNALSSKVGRLPSAGDPASPYVQVTANIWEALYELSKAGDDADQACGQTRSAARLRIARYFLDAASRELDRHEASIADIADAPPENTTALSCR